MKFKNKVVLITGAARGIGKATALAFAKQGATVIINYQHSQKEAEHLLAEIQTISQGMLLQGDVSDEQAVKEMFETLKSQYGKLDILVNNAGGYISGDERNGNANIREQSFRKNLLSAMIVSKFAGEMFLSQQNGIIVNLASRLAIQGDFESINYASSKAGLLSVTQSYAKLLAPYGRANAVSPGAVNTGYRLTAPKEELQAKISRSPHKRLIEPQEIADVILFLASEESKMITGQNILVDGGK